MLDLSKLEVKKRKIDIILDELSEEDREALLGALKDKKIDATSIARLLRNECGYEISDRSVQTYRKDILWR